MTTPSATPPATRRIARSYLADLVRATPLPEPAVMNAAADIALVDHLLGRAVKVRHVLKSDQLVLTFDLADDPAGWSTASPASQQGSSAGLANDGQIDGPARSPENREYPGQPGERTS